MPEAPAAAPTPGGRARARLVRCFRVLASAARRTCRISSSYEAISANDGHAAITRPVAVALEVVGEPMPVIEILNDWVRPLQDLLAVCLGLPVRLEDIRLGADRELRLSFEAVQPPATGHPLAAPDSYAAPTLLTFAGSTVPFAQLIAAWFSLCERVPAAITLLCGPYYAPFIYNQHHYASTFQSAEAIATADFAGREKHPSEHRQRVASVTEALQTAQLDQDTVDWATRIIQGRNDKPLRQLIEELISTTGDMGRQLLAAMPDLPQRAVGARVGVAHPLAARSGTLERYWIGEALVWVVRVHLLAQLGMAMNHLSGRVTEKAAFQEVVKELRGLAGEEIADPKPAPSTENLDASEQEEVVTPATG
jgi:hypothetical protein